MLTRHAHLIDVRVAQGLVTLYGPIVVDEIDYLPKIIARVPGVQRVDGKLTVYKEDAEIDRSQETQRDEPSVHDAVPASASTRQSETENGPQRSAGSPREKTRLFMMAAGVVVLGRGCSSR